MSFKIKGEQTLVNTVPVDSIGGAKPEPEERPLETHSIVENMDAVPAHAIAPQQTRVVVSEALGDARLRLGKQCGNCLHFNLEQGRKLYGEILDASRRGDPKANGWLLEVRAHALGTKGAVLDPEIYTSNPHAPDPIEKYMAELGLCRAYSQMMQDIMLQHPSETCPPNEGLQEMADFVHGWPGRHAAELARLKPSERLTHPSRPKPLPILYEPKDSIVDKLTEQLLSDAMFIAEGAKKA